MASQISADFEKSDLRRYNSEAVFFWGTPNAQHALCMPSFGRHHYASESRKLAYLSIELLCLATFSGTMDFFQVHQR